MPLYLKSHTVAATNNAEEMRHILVNTYDARGFYLGRSSSGFSAQAGYFNFESANLSYCSYGAPVHLRFRDDAYLRLQVCLCGSGRTKLATSDVDVDPQRIVCSPAEADFDLGERFEQFALRVKRDALEQDLALLVGSRAKQRLSLAPWTSYGSAHTKRLKDFIISTAQSIDLASDPIPPPLLREIERTIRLSILYGVPSNLSEFLLHEPKPVAAWQVNRVEDWIDANWKEDVSIEKLVMVTGAGARSIFLSFRKARGYTPMAYLKVVRLKAARDMLLKAAPGTSVTSVSFACNFMNSSHFARDYSRQFGELPSTTLQRAKART